MGKRKNIPEPLMEPLPWADDPWPVVAYCREEVIRQAHDIATVDGIERVGWMLTAWSYALHRVASKEPALTLTDVVRLGQLVEPLRNPFGLRRAGVYTRTAPGLIHRFPEWESVPRLLEILFEQGNKLDPLEFYKEFEEIHPFMDGNGRVGKVILCWRGGTLLAPVFPPNDLFGPAITNP